MEGDCQRIIDALQAHDRRLTRVEATLDEVSKSAQQRDDRLDRISARVEAIADLFGAQLATLTARQQILFWLAITLLPMIAALELWDRLFP
jgi:chromosome segregation ATPase